MILTIEPYDLVKWSLAIAFSIALIGIVAILVVLTFQWILDD